MINEENSIRLFNKLNELSQDEMLETELTIAVFKKSIDTCIGRYIHYFSKQFESACKRYNKKPDRVIGLKEEIMGGYRKEFYRIRDRIEEQFINLISKLEEIRENEKKSIVKFKEILDDNELQNKRSLAMKYIDEYNYYNALENKCIIMINDCILSIPSWAKDITKSETNELVIKKDDGFIQKLKAIFKNIFNFNNFENEFVKTKKEKLLQLTENTEHVAKDIRSRTIDDVKTIVAYQRRMENL